MFLMPISGFLFVMTGDFGVRFFNRWDLPNVIGVNSTAALITRWTHATTAALLTVALFGHWGIAIRHQRIHRDRYVHRMLPFTHQ
jgi:cytochrome b561